MYVMPAVNAVNVVQLMMRIMIAMVDSGTDMKPPVAFLIMFLLFLIHNRYCLLPRTRSRRRTIAYKIPVKR